MINFQNGLPNLTYNNNGEWNDTLIKNVIKY